jgi:hypothetical protein
MLSPTLQTLVISDTFLFILYGTYASIGDYAVSKFPFDALETGCTPDDEEFGAPQLLVVLTNLFKRHRQ